MQLSDALSNATTSAAFFQIFEDKTIDHNCCRVEVEIDPFWGTDRVAVEGYDGSVTTDFIAQQIFEKHQQILDSQDDNLHDATSLAYLLRRKIFIPLRNLVRNSYFWDNQIYSNYFDYFWNSQILIYRIRNCYRSCWSNLGESDPWELSMDFACLKHSRCVYLLSKKVD